MGSDYSYEERLQQKLAMQRHDEELEREYQMKVEMYQRQMDRMVEENRQRNRLIQQNTQNELNQQYIANIIRLNKHFHYDINPYNMSNSQLEYWYNRLHREYVSKFSGIDYY